MLTTKAAIELCGVRVAIPPSAEPRADRRALSREAHCARPSALICQLTLCGCCSQHRRQADPSLLADVSVSATAAAAKVLGCVMMTPSPLIVSVVYHTALLLTRIRRRFTRHATIGSCANGLRIALYP